MFERNQTLILFCHTLLSCTFRRSGYIANAASILEAVPFSANATKASFDIVRGAGKIYCRKNYDRDLMENMSKILEDSTLVGLSSEAFVSSFGDATS